MKAEVGEQLVGAYLKVIEGCDFVAYNIRPPGGGLRGLEELDVVGLRFRDSTAFLCEVTTHIRGILYNNNRTTIDRITAKYKRQQKYAQSELTAFGSVHFQFWSPNVPIGYLTENLEKLRPGLELVINGAYADRVAELQEAAEARENDEGNDVFRTLQILTHLRHD